MTAARSSMARRMAEASSTGWTSDLNALAKALLTARSRPRSTLSNSPTRALLDGSAPRAGSRFMVTVARIRTGQPAVQALTPSRKGVPLPEGYVPPDPTQPLYGYLTPDELEAYEAEERARLGIVPGVAEPSATEVESQPATVPWAPPSASRGGKHGAESGPLSPPLVSEVPVTEAEEATVAHTCWVPEPPPELRSAVTVAPAAEPAVTPGAMGEYSWDTYRQEWVRATS